MIGSGYVQSIVKRLAALSAAFAAQAGSTLMGWIQAGAGAVPLLAQDKLRQVVNAKDFGALSTNTPAQNKTAVQAGIAYLSTVGGGTLIIDSDCKYGYKVRDVTTHPSFVGATADIIVRDSSVGASYVLPAKDGGQVREFYYTAQSSNPLTFTAGLAGAATSGTLAAPWASTTGPWLVTFSNGDTRVVTLTNGATTATWATGLSGAATAAAQYLNPGNNDGDTYWHRSKWAPFQIVSNDSAIPPVGDPNRTVTDNRRAHFGYAIDGNIAWYHGMGTQAGFNVSDGQMAHWHLNRAMVSATAWTTGTVYVKDQNVTQGGSQYVCLANHTAGVFATDLGAGNWILTAPETSAMIIDYQTGRYNFNVDSNGFNAAYSFKERTPGVVQMILESLSANCFEVLRNSAGVTQDVLLQNASGDLKVSTNFGVGLWVASNGRTGVGVVGTPNNKLEVIDSRNGVYSAAIRNNDATAGYGVSIASGTAGTTAFSLLDCFDSVGLKCAIRGNGNIVNTNNSYGAISDVRVKENVADATPKLAPVRALHVVNFNLIEDPAKTKQIGFIAQEMQTVFPGLVDTDADSMLSVKTSVLVPILVKAVQELADMVDALSTRVQTLQGGAVQ